MELWIKSQDGLFCGVVKKVELNPLGQFICCEETDIILGKYTTVERCKEIITEISSRLKGLFILKTNLHVIKPAYRKMYIDEMINNRNVGIIDNSCELVEITTAYYEMPQE